MKVRFGDLKFQNGRTMEELVRVCENPTTDCNLCEYRQAIECRLVPYIFDEEIGIDDILNYEIEVPRVRKWIWR